MNKEELKEKYGKKRVPHQWRGTDFISAQICTFFGSGMSPKAPGTMGSLAAAIVAYPMALLFAKISTPDLGIRGTSAGLNSAFLIAAIFVFFAAIPFVKKAMKDTQTEDPSWIVIDEVCGIFMSLAFISNASILAHPWTLAVAFGLFRFFDILKPLGIHKFEAFPGAWGVMADDLLGGIYAGILMGAIAFGIGL
ncbi:phosphatidylglycerophosphatase A [Fibrobacter sp. UWH1]|uniref:phosphatidylglycerophosphatase A family protein n=1 Tax=Fibrobacter sp. UWH1 TaxID=1964354 RepID=UPI000B521756|nr:phosphatidylglycerophosphatase A [Fibrobacter sp. UWH1]OWV15075.1 phosphatidylglycerophosphatase [Fibrobacter sp. UWH1]